MEEVLNKFYEYFIKGNFQDKKSIHEGSEFLEFYKIIINLYDLSKDKQLETDMEEYFNFYDKLDMFGDRKKGLYSVYGENGEERSKRNFEQNKKASFEWFRPSPYMQKNSEFVFSHAKKRTSQSFCKAYLSVRPEKYISVILKLQDFINKLHSEHVDEKLCQCKFRKIPSNDAIVMRFACEEHYKEFLQFLDQNKEIMESYDSPNLFIPQDDHGLLLIADNGGSYNYFVSRMIWDYMFECRSNNSTVSVEGIVEYINNYDYSNDKMIYSNGQETIAKYKEILCGKLMSKPDEELLQIIFNKDNKTLKLGNNI